MAWCLPWCITTWYNPALACVLRGILIYFSIGLTREPLKLTSGVIWTALNIDYPGHSFSHLGVFFGPLT